MTESVPTGEFRIETGADYSLAASILFLEGFAPAAYTGDEAAVHRLAFIADDLDQSEQVGGAAVVQDGGTVVIETYGEAAPARVRNQVVRILSLNNLDGDGFLAVGERDPVVGRLQARYTVAAGHLEAERLRKLPVDAAHDALKTIKGIGDFAAQVILLRGAGSPDALPTSEPRLARAVAMAYGLDDSPDIPPLQDIADGWRPYRTWVALLLRTMLEDETGEIARRQGMAAG